MAYKIWDFFSGCILIRILEQTPGSATRYEFYPNHFTDRKTNKKPYAYFICIVL